MDFALPCGQRGRGNAASWSPLAEPRARHIDLIGELSEDQGKIVAPSCGKVVWTGAPRCGRASTLFGYSRAGRCRYVCVEASRASGVLAIFFFRHADGSWCVFPPETKGSTMNLARSKAYRMAGRAFDRARSAGTLRSGRPGPCPSGTRVGSARCIRQPSKNNGTSTMCNLDHPRDGFRCRSRSDGIDVVIVGGGPAGLAAAIRLKQLAAESGVEIGVCVLEKGSEIGAHILSGAVMDPRAMNELIPDWKEQGAPLDVPVTEDGSCSSRRRGATAVPNWALPDSFKNHGNYVISLANVTRWLGSRPKRWASRSSRASRRPKCCTTTTALSRASRPAIWASARTASRPKTSSRHGAACEVHAVLRRRARASRTPAERQFKLRESADPQVYGIGIKELWEIDPAKHRPGLVIHTAGWPLESDTYGGAFLYHLATTR